MGIFGKRTVPLDNFLLGHSPYRARVGLELGVGLVEFGLGLVGLLVVGLGLGLGLWFGLGGCPEGEMFDTHIIRLPVITVISQNFYQSRVNVYMLYSIIFISQRSIMRTTTKLVQLFTDACFCAVIHTTGEIRRHIRRT